MALHMLATRDGASGRTDLFSCFHPVACCCDSLTVASIILHPLRCWPWLSLVVPGPCL